MNELEEAVRKCVFDELCVFCTKRVYTHCEYMNKTKNEPICKEGKVVYSKFIAGTQWQAKQSPWISVEEYLPPDLRKNVLLKVENAGVLVGLGLNVKETDLKITHWMLIPEVQYKTKKIER